jgi:hypothetical protein
MAILSKQQQNELILLGVKLVGSVIIAVAVSKVRHQLEKR